jgi:signal transduction histidine kinase
LERRWWARQSRPSTEVCIWRTRLAASASLSHGCDQIVSVQSLILSVGDLLREAFGDSVSLQTCVAEGTPPVRCDPATLENVLLNLAISVRNSMPEGGLLLIESRGRGSTGAVNRGDFGELVSITVTSAHQPSVSRERAAQAARPLFEGSGRRTGTPIALTNVKRFAGAMGGSAESETLDGGGTSVRLLLPAFRGNFER